MKNMIELDGAVGEGGGQILRTALTLSMITGQPFRIVNIRAGRSKPGLMRQHLVAVQAAAEICNAKVGAVAVGAQTLEFTPGPIKGGDYAFAIGSAGSCTLVLQTIFPALLHAPTASVVRVTGGTHNSMAPPAQFLQRAYGRLLERMGAMVDIELRRYGFYPAGGGELIAHVEPCAQLKQIDLRERGERVDGYAECFVAGIPGSVAKRELECVGLAMGWDEAQLRVRGLPNEYGPGNALLLTLEYEHVTEVFCAFGEKAVRAEQVAKRAVDEARRYIASGAAVGEHLADQFMLPMALAGGGSFTTDCVSDHSKTNAAVIARFLPVRIDFDDCGSFKTCTVRTV
ncbi:RNA 3'-terminal phosphate cyclase [Massilia glaciei]|uniref:RNA 3'-terminal phosphate cyclase n=2 Tax=Massilia glaciei TaxID=1524097 RepID=A0A2U2I7C1_9BURK|nr:RNA 3'-terminal phosphate cyclase [Massilia glaciei]